MNKKVVIGLSLISALALVGCAVGEAAWQAVVIRDSNGNTDDALYGVQYHVRRGAANGDAQIVNGPANLELTSDYDLLELAPIQSDLMNDRFYFTGWHVGFSDGPTSTRTTFTSAIDHSPLALKTAYGSVPNDATFHLWDIWADEVRSTDVVFDVTYNTNQHYRTLVAVTDIFYLFNINLPVEGYHATTFTYNAIDFDVNDSLDLTVATTFSELGASGTRIIPLTATLEANS